MPRQENMDYNDNLSVPFVIKQKPLTETEERRLYKAQLELDLQLQSLQLPKVSMVNASFELNCSIDLKALAKHSHNVSYSPSRNKSLFMLLYSPRTRSIVHSSGKIIVMGAVDETEARRAARLHARNIYKIHTCWCNGVDVDYNKPIFTNFHISHIFGNANLKSRVRIDEVAAEYCQYTTFNPQIHHTAIKINLPFPKSTVVLYRTGRVNISGIKDELDLLKVFHTIVCMTNPFLMN